MKIWKKLRLKSKATPYEIAKELNIDEDKYIEIEEGVRSMPSSLINTAGQIYYKKEKENDMTAKLKEYEIESELSKLSVYELVQKFNFKNAVELANAIGVGLSTLYRLPNNIESLGLKTKQRIYDFITDELNIQIDKEHCSKKHNKRVKDRLSIDETIEIFSKTMNITKLSQKELAKKLNINSSAISRGFRGICTTTPEIKEKCEEIIKTYTFENTETEKDENTNKCCEKSEPIDNSNIIDEDNTIIDEDNTMIEYVIKNLQEENEELKRIIKCYQILIEKL